MSTERDFISVNDSDIDISRYPKEKKIESGEGLDHYKNDRLIETCILMEQVAKNVYNETHDISKALWSAMAMKHLDRVGTKEIANVNEELLKVENYVHRARTGKWINK